MLSHRVERLGWCAPRVQYRPIMCRATKPSQQQRDQAQQTTSPVPPSASTEPGAGLKAVWYAAELLGKAIGRGSTASADASSSSERTTLSRDQVLACVRADYDVNYFISGAGDMAAYAPDCVFRDPFVAFKGTDRFKQNVGNLGGLMRDVKLDVYEFAEQGDDRILTRWRFSCVLDLPWRPLLAAAGSTTHVIDLQKGQVVEHIEAWDVEPAKVVRQLFRPASKMPSNAWETFMLSASEGDAAGMWLASSPLLLKASAPVVGVSLACKAITGEGLPGVALGALEGVSWLLVLAASVTEVFKLAKNFGGGESG